MIEIHATADPDTGRPGCRMLWGKDERHLSVTATRQHARDLMAAASDAEGDAALLAVLMDRKGLALRLDAAGVFLFDVRSKRATMVYGREPDLTVAPEVMSKTLHPMIRLRLGKQNAGLTPGEARTMAQHWMEIAEGAERDAITRYVLRGDERYNVVEVEDFFSRMARLRAEGLKDA